MQSIIVMGTGRVKDGTSSSEQGACLWGATTFARWSLLRPVEGELVCLRLLEQSSRSYGRSGTRLRRHTSSPSTSKMQHSSVMHPSEHPSCGHRRWWDRRVRLQTRSSAPESRIARTERGIMTVYLDHNATSPLLPEVVAAMQPYLVERFGNPSSIHGLGIEAERAMEGARLSIARNLGVLPTELVFTSGGTEANNLALLGAARVLHRRGRHVVVTAAEHDSVFEPAQSLIEEGFEVDVAPLDPRGLVDGDRLAGLLRPDTVVVACLLASHETGAIQPVCQVASLVRKHSPYARFHVDAVQALGKTAVSPSTLDCDSLCGTAHKLGGPKGVGFLYLRAGAHIRPLTFGGGQEKGLRPGTQDVPAIVGLACALGLAFERQRSHLERWHRLRQRLLEDLERIVQEAFFGGATLRVNTPMELSVPSTLSLGFPGTRGEILVRALEDHGVICSTGPACHERTGKRGSRTLQAMGLSLSEQESTVRISFGPGTTDLDVDTAREGFLAALTRLAWMVSGSKGSRRRQPV